LNEQLTIFDLFSESKPNPQESLIDIDATSKKLGVSTATIRNWVKLGSLKRAEATGRKLLFYEKDVDALFSNISTGKSDKLTKRRNKKAVKGLDLYTDYIESDESNLVIATELSSKNPSLFSENNLRIVLTTLAYELYTQIEHVEDLSLAEFIDSKKSSFSVLLTDLLADSVLTENVSSLVAGLNVPKFIPYQDFLGFIYISLNKLSNRKTTGSYFTPVKVVKHMISLVSSQHSLTEETILDPSCGTGNFLLYAIQNGVKPEHIYGRDIDDISISIARINLYLNGLHDIDLLKSHLLSTDTLSYDDHSQYDIILGNPPWGYDFSMEQKASLIHRYKSASLHGCESYDIFIEKSLDLLKENGMLAFVLPEAILNVNTHSTIRHIITSCCSIDFISYLGNAFHGVDCPSILFGISKNGKSSCVGCKVESGNQSFVIKNARSLDEDYWNFAITDSEDACLKTIANSDNKLYLKGQADFALGIVTGSNKDYISSEKNENNEIVLRGSNIYKYRFTVPDEYIKFEPENFQQVAPTKFYRAPEKLLYRFICSVPVFCYDNQQTLSLNSANILIPHVDGINIKYILAILNSLTVAFWCKKKYNSVKLLRSHIENIPIPVPNKDQQIRIVEMVDAIISSEENDKLDMFNELENIIMDLYQLDINARDIINKSSEPRNSFL